MVNLREQIAAEMKKQGISSGLALSKKLKGKISQQSIDDFLKGRGEMKSGNIEKILDVLGGEVKFITPLLCKTRIVKIKSKGKSPYLR